jgi:undecaprenyl-diphosphatase
VGRVRTYAIATAAILIALVLAAVGFAEEPGALSDWQAFILGIVQGLTELLPISSSGHLILVPWLAEWTFLQENDAFNQTFDVALHLGTTVAVVMYFWADASRLTVAWVRTLGTRSVKTTDERISWFVAIATLPALAVGGLFGSKISDNLGEPWQIAILLAVFGVVLWIADRRPATRTFDDLTMKTGVFVGLLQCLALMPGVSRSGITISAGRFLGLNRDAAARFSFLLLIPVSVAAVIYTAVKDIGLGELPSGWEGPFLVGTIAAFGSGLLAIQVLFRVIRRHSFTGFVVYRLIAALVILLLIASGVRSATF